MGSFVFDTFSSDEMGLVVERRPRQYVPRKRITAHQIPGRSGDLHQWDGSWENFTQVYDCWFKASPVAGQAHKIKQWLCSAAPGTMLEDSYDETVFHYATYIGGADIENIHDRFGRFTVAFDCAPQAFLKTGNIALNITGSGLLNNPTRFDAKPLIEVTGSTGGLITIGDTHLQVRFPEYDTKTIRVDCELREAWDITDGGETSMNEWITGNEFPVIVPGTNQVEITGGIDSIRVWPRWWTL